MPMRSCVHHLRRSLAAFSSSSSPPRILQIGTALRKSRCFSEADVRAYSDLTGDANPVHFHLESAVVAGFLRPVVHGMLVASLFPRVIASSFPAAVYVSQRLDFRSPVYIGEEIVAEVQATAIRSVRNRFLAKFSTKCFRSGEEVPVLDGEAAAVLPTLAVIS
ncbi:hydroxyacyl-thioester dehydratase type-like protein [Wolffia australiana]